ncbi:MAG: sugar transferase [Bacteroidales bacterium]|nr:sugar transferase [Bacteroidales bacterium]
MRQIISTVFPGNLTVVKNGRNRDLEISSGIGKPAFKFIGKYINFSDSKSFYISDNVEVIEKDLLRKPYTSIISLKRLNDIQRIDSFISLINTRLDKDGLYVGCCETGILKKKQIFKKYFSPINHIIFFCYFVYRRIFPKLPYTKKLVELFSKGKNRAMSKVEMMGRLYYGGFEIVEEKEIGELNYFVVKKTKEPSINGRPTFYPLIRLNRIGKKGNLISVYKLRTMHPYSEYLQEYIYKNNQLDEGGKFKNDIRISPLGNFMRKFWIDEIPMLYNLLKGDLKLFGVRPISEQYFSLYTEELKHLRTRHKPGLIPPYYADLPKNIDEIIASEKKYLLAYEKSPYLTDCIYLFRALFNILIKGKHSK